MSHNSSIKGRFVALLNRLASLVFELSYTEQPTFLLDYPVVSIETMHLHLQIQK